ncbi:hypothetical protein SGPA1_21123 [Streptomyces misionensis JCM 4497]
MSPSAGADRRAHRLAGHLAVVVQPPEQQPLLLAGRHGTRAGGARRHRGRVLHRTLYGRLVPADLPGQQQHQVHQEGVPGGRARRLGDLADLPPGRRGLTEHQPQRGQVVARQVPARVLPVDQHRAGRGEQHVRQQRVAVAELEHALAAHLVRDAVQQLLQVAEVPVGEQAQLVVPRDPGGVVQRHVEQAGRGPPGVHPADRAERRPDVRAGGRLHRMPLERRHPARHPLDDQGAVVRIRRDQPGHPDRRPVPDERAVYGYFVPAALRPCGRVVQQALGDGRGASRRTDEEHGPAAAPQDLDRRELRADPLHRGDRRAQRGALGAGQVESPAQRLRAGLARDPPRPGCAQHGAARTHRRVEIRSAARRAGAQRPGRGGHGGRCRVHGRYRSLRCLRCLPVGSSRRPGPGSRAHPGECPRGDRVGVALSYLTPDGPWHTIWRTLANPGE